ncbi:MAG: alpha/beta hydrolase [Chloroflexi bacterium]|nr:alpha/beta hydrolase [Chloroflexota bacterium]
MTDKKANKRVGLSAWAARIGLLLGGLLLGFLSYTTISQSIHDARVLNNPPEASTFYPVGDGRQVHVYPSGSDNPDDIALVFVGCIVCSSEFWQAIQLEAGEFVQTYAFDQANVTWSDPGPPAYPANIAADLADFLAQIEEEQVILAGFSAGMLPIFRYMDNPNPDAPEVVALVSFEGSILHEDEVLQYADSSPIGLTDTTANLVLQLGIGRLLVPFFQGPLDQSVNVTNRDYYDRVRMTTGTRKALQAWHEQFSPQMVADVREMTESIVWPTDVIVYVFDPDNAPEAAFIQQQTAEQIELFNQRNSLQEVWYQDWVAAAQPESRYIVVEDSSHSVMLDRPEVILTALDELVTLLRERQ